MRANEFIGRDLNEGKTTKLRKGQKAASKGIRIARDQGGYDRTYHMNRLLMAMAVADGESTKSVDSPADTWFEKYNTIHPYTKQEDNMAKAGLNTVPSDTQQVAPWSKSVEADDVGKTSPVAQWNKPKKVKESATGGSSSSAGVASSVSTGEFGNGFLNGGPGSTVKKKKSKVIKRSL